MQFLAVPVLLLGFLSSIFTGFLVHGAGISLHGTPGVVTLQNPGAAATLRPAYSYTAGAPAVTTSVVHHAPAVAAVRPAAYTVSAAAPALTTSVVGAAPAVTRVAYGGGLGYGGSLGYGVSQRVVSAAPATTTYVHQAPAVSYRGYGLGYGSGLSYGTGLGYGTGLSYGGLRYGGAGVTTLAAPAVSQVRRVSYAAPLVSTAPAAVSYSAPASVTTVHHAAPAVAVRPAVSYATAPAVAAYRTAAVAAPVATFGAGLGFGHTVTTAPASYSTLGRVSYAAPGVAAVRPAVSFATGPALTAVRPAAVSYAAPAVTAVRPAVTYSTAPAVNAVRPAVTVSAAPAVTAVRPAVSYSTGPALSYTTGPAVSYSSAPAVTTSYRTAALHAPVATFGTGLGLGTTFGQSLVSPGYAAFRPTVSYSTPGSTVTTVHHAAPAVEAVRPAAVSYSVAPAVTAVRPAVSFATAPAVTAVRPAVSYTTAQAVRPAVSLSYSAAPAVAAVRPAVSYTTAPAVAAVRPAVSYTTAPAVAAVRPAVSYTTAPAAAAVRPAVSYTTAPAVAAVRPAVSYTTAPAVTAVRPAALSYVTGPAYTTSYRTAALQAPLTTYGAGLSYGHTVSAPAVSYTTGTPGFAYRTAAYAAPVSMYGAGIGLGHTIASPALSPQFRTVSYSAPVVGGYTTSSAAPATISYGLGGLHTGYATYHGSPTFVHHAAAPGTIVTSAGLGSTHAGLVGHGLQYRTLVSGGALGGGLSYGTYGTYGVGAPHIKVIGAAKKK